MSARKLTYSDFNDRGRGPNIHNEAAYEAATQKAIKENARKGKNKRWLAEDETRAALMVRVADKAERGDKFMKDMYMAHKEWGALSEKQEAAVRASFARDDARRAEFIARDSGSVHIGTVGKRETFVLEVRTVVELRDDWSGEIYARIVIMADEAGNVVVYKGNSLQMEVSEATTRRAAKGDKLEFLATVKEHGERDGNKQTVVARPKLKAFRD